MKLALGFAITLAALAASSGCASGSQQNQASSSPAASQPAGSTTEPASIAEHAPATQLATVATTTRTTKPVAKKPSYSCFTYVAGNTTTSRHVCTRTEDCGPYLEQARRVAGFRELSGCANVPSVHCFHVVATKDEPAGLDMCQPTLDACQVARADVVQAKMSVESECAQP